MKTAILSSMNPPSDVELVELSLGGSHEAYRRIVERYQNLICSMAYSACGSFARSEDIAQEVFVAAWKQLATLRERAKFKSWLCGIARNLINNALRRDRRDATSAAAPLEAVMDQTGTAPPPSELAISREDETAVWNALAQVPETYREPLVLFYREQQSVEEVARALDLSEDAVKQRLSRGRVMLRQQVAVLVEGALGRTRPGKTFALAVIASLPALATPAAAVTVAATTKGSVAVKSVAALSWAGAILGPVLGLLGGYLGARASIENTKSPRERQFMVKLNWLTLSLAAGFTLALLVIGWFGRALAAQRPGWFTGVIIGVVFSYLIALLALIFWGNRRQREIQLAEGTHWTQQASQPAAALQPSSSPMPGFHYRSKTEFLGLPLVHICSGPTREKPFGVPVAKGWVAIGGIAYGGLFALGGVACGGIAVGGFTVGLISISGLAIGVLALGGMAAGVWAMGGGALGVYAFGGAAVAWKAAWGGFALAHEIAVGGQAIAAHANDGVARSFVGRHAFFKTAQASIPLVQWLWLLALVPVVAAWRVRARQSRQK